MYIFTEFRDFDITAGISLISSSSTTCRSYCMVCVSVWEENHLASGLLPIQTQTIQQLAYCTGMHVIFVHCKIFDVNH